ncbi:MAG TPA: flavodoxin domain-containing protein [Mycobacteriales bacterium]|nr:flavodoxin domain-containing protein [Mycobacteriales bacterium]
MVDPVRVLVVYGSSRGGTAGLAHLVADAFVRHQIRAEVRRAGDARDPRDFDAIVVGGALYNNRWHPDAVAFVGRHRRELCQLPVWFFSSGPLDDSARSGALAPVPQVNALAREIDIQGHMTFGGLLDHKPGGLIGLFAWGPEGDFRDRHHVAEWVERIAGELSSDHESMVRVIGPDRRPVAAARPPAPAPAIVLPSEPQPEPEETPPTRSNGSVSRLKRYLTLDEEEADDEGLDLLLDDESLDLLEDAET